MRTPDGKNCPYYYIHTHRRVTEVALCHLLQGQADAAHWQPALCATCPVPAIKHANGCENLRIHAHIGKRKWRFWEKDRLLIQVTCTRTGKTVKNPYLGCGLCHSPIEFVVQETTDAT